MPCSGVDRGEPSRHQQTMRSRSGTVQGDSESKHHLTTGLRPARLDKVSIAASSTPPQPGRAGSSPAPAASNGQVQERFAASSRLRHSATYAPPDTGSLHCGEWLPGRRGRMIVVMNLHIRPRRRTSRLRSISTASHRPRLRAQPGRRRQPPADPARRLQTRCVAQWRPDILSGPPRDRRCGGRRRSRQRLRRRVPLDRASALSGVDAADIDSCGRRGADDPVHAPLRISHVMSLHSAERPRPRGPTGARLGLTDADTPTAVVRGSVAGCRHHRNLAGRVPLDEFLQPQAWKPADTDEEMLPIALLGRTGRQSERAGDEL